MDAVLHYQIASISWRHRQGVARGAQPQLTETKYKKHPLRCFFSGCRHYTVVRQGSKSQAIPFDPFCVESPK